MDKLESVKERCNWRGKHVSYNTWVYGTLDIDKCDIAMISHCIDKRNIPVSNEVIKETLGQYAGFKDKNGKEIYEDDIVKDSFGDLGVVKWSGFNFLIDYNNNWVADFIDVDFDDLEVIGNIHDNSELLKDC